MSVRVEQLTPYGVAGVAVVAVHGAGSAQVLTRLAARLPAVGRARLCALERDGELLDEALVVRRADEHFELGLHGSLTGVEAVIDALGVPRSQPELTCVEELALDYLRTIAPHTDRAARVLLDQARGALRREVEALRQATEGIPDWRARFARVRQLLLPPTVVLAGPVNAGKSTLFNLWVGEDRALTSSEEGTTRDAITASARVGYHEIQLIDTAGDRSLGSPTEGPADAATVEAMGQELAADLRDRADLVVWLAPRGSEEAAPEGALVVTSRCDEIEETPERGISVHADPTGSLERVSAWVAEALELPAGDPWVPGQGTPVLYASAGLLQVAFESPPGPERDECLDLVLGPEPSALMLP